MKKLISVFLITLIFQTKGEAQDYLANTHPIVVQIQSLNFSQFTGLPVDTLLAHLPSGYTLEIQGSVVAKKAGYLAVKYAPYTYVYIAVRTFGNMNPELSPTGNPTQNWNLNLFKKEKISFTIAFNGQCINGCENKNKIH